MLKKWENLGNINIDELIINNMSDSSDLTIKSINYGDGIYNG
jgi:hypothetical protein